MGPTERQSRILWSSVTTLAVGILIGLIGLLLWSLGWLANRLSSVMVPLAIAGVLAFILDPVVDFFEKRMRSRIKAIFTVFALAVLLVVGLASTVLPRLISEIQSFTSQVPTHVLKVRERVDAFLKNPPHWLPSSLLTPLPNPALEANAPANTTHNNTNEASASVRGGDQGKEAVSSDKTPLVSADPISKDGPGFTWNVDVTASVFAWMSRSLPKVGSWILDQVSLAASVVSLIAGLALVPVYLFYFLLEKRGIQQRWHEFLPLRDSGAKDEIIFVLSSINDCLVVFFRGQVLVAMCVGTILATGFMLLGLNYALLLGVMAGVLGVVPYLGVATSLVPAVAIAVAQFGDWWHPLAVLGIFGFAQLLEGLVISPRIIGDRVGLHPLTIIISVMVGATLLGGILGGVLAIPLTAALRTLMFRYVWKRRREVAVETSPSKPDPASSA